jgi:homocysteine S-methyltransferase
MDLAERFAQGLVLDGGLATELERRGADLRDDLWSARVLLEAPERIREVHAAYFAAGAQVAITASYQASYEGLARRGLDPDDTNRLLRRSVELAREVAGPDRLVAASVGPYGATLADGSEYVGGYGLTARELADWHRPRIEALLSAAPDLLAVETIPAVEEVEAILAVLEDLPDARAWIACSCRDAERISDGTPFADVAALAASSPQVVAVGVNCTPPAFVASLLRSAEGIEKPLLAYPNLGSRWDAETRTWHVEGPRPDFGALAADWREAGANSIGGCCGTTPDDIAAILATVQG